MDALIPLFIIIGLSVLGSSKKQKKAQEKTAKKAKAFHDAGEALQQAQEKIPFNKDEWMALLKEQSGTSASPASLKAAEVRAKASLVQEKRPQPPKQAAPVSEKLAPIKAKPAKAAAAVHLKTALAHDEPEGSISTQGESRAEHAAHLARIHAEEEKLRQAQQTLREVRSLNRQKLQNAVIMSEILDKPVSLRRRRFG